MDENGRYSHYCVYQFAEVNYPNSYRLFRHVGCSFKKSNAEDLILEQTSQLVSTSGEHLKVEIFFNREDIPLDCGYGFLIERQEVN